MTPSKKDKISKEGQHPQFVLLWSETPLSRPTPYVLVWFKNRYLAPLGHSAPPKKDKSFCRVLLWQFCPSLEARRSLRHQPRTTRRTDMTALTTLATDIRRGRDTLLEEVARIIGGNVLVLE